MERIALKITGGWCILNNKIWHLVASDSLRRVITIMVLQTSKIRCSDGPGQPIFSVRQVTIFKRLVCRTTIMFCPSDSIYLKANTLLGMGLTVIQNQPSWSCLPAWHAWCLYHVYWSKTRLKLVSTENNITNLYEPYVWIKGHYDRKM